MANAVRAANTVDVEEDEPSGLCDLSPHRRQNEKASHGKLSLFYSQHQNNNNNNNNNNKNIAARLRTSPSSRLHVSRLPIFFWKQLFPLTPPALPYISSVMLSAALKSGRMLSGMSRLEERKTTSMKKDEKEEKEGIEEIKHSAEGDQAVFNGSFPCEDGTRALMGNASLSPPPYPTGVLSSVKDTQKGEEEEEGEELAERWESASLPPPPLSIFSSCSSCTPPPSFPRPLAPPGRCCHSMTAYADRYLIVFGGASSSCDIEDDVWVFDVEQQRWTLHECLEENTRNHHRRRRVGDGDVFLRLNREDDTDEEEEEAEMEEEEEEMDVEEGVSEEADGEKPRWLFDFPQKCSSAPPPPFPRYVQGNYLLHSAGSHHHEHHITSNNNDNMVALSNPGSHVATSRLAFDFSSTSSSSSSLLSSSPVLTSIPKSQSFIYSYSYSPSSGLLSEFSSRDPSLAFSDGLTANRSGARPCVRIIHSSCIYQHFLIVYGGHGSQLNLSEEGGQGDDTPPPRTPPPPPPPPLSIFPPLPAVSTSTSLLFSSSLEEERPVGPCGASDYTFTTVTTAGDRTAGTGSGTSSNSRISSGIDTEEEEHVNNHDYSADSSGNRSSRYPMERHVSHTTHIQREGSTGRTTVSPSQSGEQYLHHHPDNSSSGGGGEGGHEGWIQEADGATTATTTTTTTSTSNNMTTTLTTTMASSVSATGTLRDMFVLDLKRWRWRHLGYVPAAPFGPGAREYHTSHVYQERMYVFMGFGENEHDEDEVGGAGISVGIGGGGAGRGYSGPAPHFPSLPYVSDLSLHAHSGTSGHNIQEEEMDVVASTPRRLSSTMEECRVRSPKRRRSSTHSTEDPANDGLDDTVDEGTEDRARRRPHREWPHAERRPTLTPRSPPLPPSPPSPLTPLRKELVWYLDLHTGKWHPALPLSPTAPPTRCVSPCAPSATPSSCHFDMCAPPPPSISLPPAPLPLETYETLEEEHHLQYPPHPPHHPHPPPTPRLPFLTDSEAPQKPLGGHSSALEGDRVYIFGGTSSKSRWELQSYSNEVYIFHLGTHQWQHIRVDSSKPSPPPRYGAAMGVADGVVYIHGGDRPEEEIIFGDFWRLDTKSKEPEWEEIPPLLVHPLRHPIKHERRKKKEEEEEEHDDGEEEEEREGGRASSTRGSTPVKLANHKAEHRLTHSIEYPLMGTSTDPSPPLLSFSPCASSSSSRTSSRAPTPLTLSQSPYFNRDDPPPLAPQDRKDFLVPYSLHNLERPMLRTGAAYATIRGKLYLMGGEVIHLSDDELTSLAQPNPNSLLPPNKMNHYPTTSTTATTSRSSRGGRYPPAPMIPWNSPSYQNMRFPNNHFSPFLLPQGFPTIFYYEENTTVKYSNDVFVYPLKVSVTSNMVAPLPSSTSPVLCTEQKNKRRWRWPIPGRRRMRMKNGEGEANNGNNNNNNYEEEEDGSKRCELGNGGKPGPGVPHPLIPTATTAVSRCTGRRRGESPCYRGYPHRRVCHRNVNAGGGVLRLFNEGLLHNGDWTSGGYLFDDWTLLPKKENVEGSMARAPQTLLDGAARWICGSLVRKECNHSSSTSSNSSNSSDEASTSSSSGAMVVLSEISRARGTENLAIRSALSSYIPSRLFED